MQTTSGPVPQRLSCLGKTECPEAHRVRTPGSQARGTRRFRPFRIGLVRGLALPLLAFLSLAPLILTAADTSERKAAEASPSEKAPLSPASTDRDGGAIDAPVSPGRMMDTLDAKQKLGVGDTVIFRVLEDQEAGKSLSVTDAGELDVPELGLVKAAGKTCKQLAFEIKTELERTTYYHATVLVGIQLLNKTSSGRRIYLAGEVRRTGPQEIPAGEIWTLSRAIMGAGGFTDYANKKQVRLVRAAANGAPRRTFVINISNVLEKGRTEEDIAVEPEDLIYVPGRAINF